MYFCDTRWDSGDIFRETCTPAGIQRFHGDGFQGTMCSVTLQDTAVNELCGSPPVSTRAVGRHEHDEIRLYAGLRGAVALQDPHDQGGDAYVSAGTYFMHHVVTENDSTPRPRSAPVFIFPGDPLRSLSPGNHAPGRPTRPRRRSSWHTPAWPSGPCATSARRGAHESRNVLLELCRRIGRSAQSTVPEKALRAVGSPYLDLRPVRRGREVGPCALRHETLDPEDPRTDISWS